MSNNVHCWAWWLSHQPDACPTITSGWWLIHACPTITSGWWLIPTCPTITSGWWLIPTCPTIISGWWLILACPTIASSWGSIPACPTITNGWWLIPACPTITSGWWLIPHETSSSTHNKKIYVKHLVEESAGVHYLALLFKVRRVSYRYVVSSVGAVNNHSICNLDYSFTKTTINGEKMKEYSTKYQISEREGAMEFTECLCPLHLSTSCKSMSGAWTCKYIIHTCSLSCQAAMLYTSLCTRVYILTTFCSKSSNLGSTVCQVITELL